MTFEIAWTRGDARTTIVAVRTPTMGALFSVEDLLALFVASEHERI